jgi:hypothetical protein
MMLPRVVPGLRLLVSGRADRDSPLTPTTGAAKEKEKEKEREAEAAEAEAEKCSGRRRRS